MCPFASLGSVGRSLPLVVRGVTGVKVAGVLNGVTSLLASTSIESSSTRPKLLKLSQKIAMNGIVENLK